MSKWKEIKIEDISIDDGDVNIYIESDNEGNNYIYFNFEEFKKLIEEKNGN